MEWISVKDMLPDKTMKVFFCDTSALYPDNVFSGVFYKGKHWRSNRWHRSGSYISQSNITHWMPLPAPPNS